MNDALLACAAVTLNWVQRSRWIRLVNSIDLACATVMFDWFDGRWWIRLVNFTEYACACTGWVACKGLSTQKEKNMHAENAVQRTVPRAVDEEGE